jgi:MFS superfamily sulfate permease-like transporter
VMVGFMNALAVVITRTQHEAFQVVDWLAD